MFQYTGEYKKYTSSNRSKMDYYTFTPSPLCDGIPLPVDDELFTLLTTAHKLLGVLEGLTMFAPDSAIIKDFSCIKEGHYSLLLETEDSKSFYDLLKLRGAKYEDLCGLNNVVAAQKYSYDKSISNYELSKICSLATCGQESSQAAEIRKNQIYFRRIYTILTKYMPTAPEDIVPAFDDLTKFICMDNHTDILIKTALAHYQFEMIHPFEKCNGIVGRILIPMMLLHEQYQAAPYLCISEYLYHHKEEYFDKLSATQMGSGYAYWVKFIVQAICVAAEQSIYQVEQFVKTVEKDIIRVRELSKTSKYLLPVYDYFKRYLISEIKPISEEIGISYNTATKVVAILADAGILKLEHEQSRHKVFLYSKIHEIINTTQRIEV